MLQEPFKNISVSIKTHFSSVFTLQRAVLVSLIQLLYKVQIRTRDPVSLISFGAVTGNLYLGILEMYEFDISLSSQPTCPRGPNKK